jgi:hypothetical protein
MVETDVFIGQSIIEGKRNGPLLPLRWERFLLQSGNILTKNNPEYARIITSTRPPKTVVPDRGDIPCRAV